MIYLDNAATSFPKPPEVCEAMVRFMSESSGNPGRSGHRLSVAAGHIIYDAREELADFFGLTNPLRLVFTSNVTEAINLVLFGLLRPGDHVITSGIEHNAVMRPLRYLERNGVQISVAPCYQDGKIKFEEFERLFHPHTRLVIINHASNVNGTIQDIARIGEICRSRNTLFLVDAAQTAGVIPINIRKDCIDLLAYTGHKGLMGPTGTGGLLIGDRVVIDDLKPLVRGGTGSRSEFEEQPDFLPDRFESGTPNSVGIAGLLAGLRYVQKFGLEDLRQFESKLTSRLVTGLQDIKGVKVYGPSDPLDQVAVVSFTLSGYSVSEVGMWLDDNFGILCRPGLHCAPVAHRTIGTFPEGTVRFAPGVFSKIEDIDDALRAVRILAQEVV